MSRGAKKALTFIIITFFLNYLMIFLYFALGGKWVMPGAQIIGVAYMFIPAIVAVVVQKYIYRERVREPLGVSFKFNRWFLLAWLLPPVIAFATLGVSLLFPGVEYSPEMAGMFERYKDLIPPEQLEQMKDQVESMEFHPIWLGLLSGLVAGVTVNAVAAFGEELGWRGFLLNELGHLGFWKSSAIIGLVWGVWHAPIILQGHNYPQHPTAGVLMMIVFTLLLSPIFSFVRLKSRSVIAAAIAHGSINGTVGLAVMMVKGGSDLTVGVTGLAGFIVLVAVNIALFFYGRNFGYN